MLQLQNHISVSTYLKIHNYTQTEIARYILVCYYIYLINL
jgi:hypothetical protein